MSFLGGLCFGLAWYFFVSFVCLATFPEIQFSFLFIVPQKGSLPRLIGGSWEMAGFKREIWEDREGLGKAEEKDGRATDHGFTAPCRDHCSFSHSGDGQGRRVESETKAVERSNGNRFCFDRGQGSCSALGRLGLQLPVPVPYLLDWSQSHLEQVTDEERRGYTLDVVFLFFLCHAFAV